MSPLRAIILLASLCHAACITGTARNEDGPPRDASDKDGPVVDALPDSIPSELIFKDLQPPNDLPPPAPDLCPTGFAACGGICVDLQTDFLHCGACDNGCLASTTDSCVGGMCVCGGTGGPCDGSRDCTAGKCACKEGGLCDGCCDGSKCIVKSELSAGLCGADGKICQACDDSDPCTQDLCSPGGVCEHPFVPDIPPVVCSPAPRTVGYCCAGTCCAGSCCGSGVCCPAGTTCCGANCCTIGLETCDGAICIPVW